MRKRNILHRFAAVSGTVMLTAAMMFSAVPAAADEADAGEVELEEEDWGDEDLIEIDDSGDLDIDEELSPEEEELNEYIEANYASDLLEKYDSVRYEQSMWNEDGSENAMSGYIYRDKDLIYVYYKDGFVEKITKDSDDGFDPDLNRPVRYVYADEETKQDNIDNYEELFYLWGQESVTERKEADGKLTFITQSDDEDFIDYIMSDLGRELEEGKTYTFSRETVFDKESRLLLESTVSLVDEKGTSDVVFECSLTVNPEKGYEEDTELFAKLNAEDTHSLKLVIDPKTEEEIVVEAKVGKGCVFYPLIYDGYTYYTDEECTLVATEEELYDTENDVVLYAAFEEIPEDEELADDEYELEIGEDGEIDLSELFGDSEADVVG